MPKDDVSVHTAYFPDHATLQGGTIPARAVIFFYLFNSLYLWKRNDYEQLQFYLVKKIVITNNE